jgi:hypothetical protein
LAALATAGLAPAAGAAQTPPAARAAQTTPAATPGVTPAISTATLSIDRRQPPLKIPPSFLGLSTEYWTLPVDERHVALYERMLSLLHVPGDGPFVLRIGGDSASHTLYDPNLSEPPRWAFELTPSFIERTASIVKKLRLRVILDLNLVTGSPQLAAAWARVAEARLPRKSIIGFEIANEPDLYDKAFWLFTTGGEQFSGQALPADITPRDYALDSTDTRKPSHGSCPACRCLPRRWPIPWPTGASSRCCWPDRIPVSARSAVIATRTRVVRCATRPSIRHSIASSASGRPLVRPACCSRLSRSCAGPPTCRSASRSSTRSRAEACSA